MNIEITPKKIFTGLLVVITILLSANIVGLIFEFYFGHDYVYGLVPLFNFNTEGNVPTLYSSVSLILCGILLSGIALTHKRRNSSYMLWSGLSVIFIFLAVDETASLHEKLIVPIREAFNVSGLLYYAWVIPYGVALVVFVTSYMRFMIRLPTKVRFLFVLSGIIYVSGAIGFELDGGLHASLHGTTNLIYSVLFTFEESFEMVGIAIFIYTLLLYITIEFGNFSIGISNNVTG